MRQSDAQAPQTTEQWTMVFPATPTYKTQVLKSDTSKGQRLVRRFTFTYGCIDSGSYFFHLLRSDVWNFDLGTRTTSEEHIRLSDHLFQTKKLKRERQGNNLHNAPAYSLARPGLLFYV
jgi:hypothetical protein